MLDYYQRAFLLLQAELERGHYSIELPHPIRKRFWGLLSYRQYDPIESRPLVLSYMHSVEQELAKSLSRYSIAYWLHLYRRISPEPIGIDKKPYTVGLVRATLEAAIQKYARLDLCDRVGRTSEISIDEVLGGILMAPEFEVEREILQAMDQLVLTNFGSTELREFYDTEKLAYELWRSSAMLRIIGKGASIVVDDSQQCVYDARSDDLHKLVSSFDERNAVYYPELLSSKGLVSIDPLSSSEASGIAFLPVYNLGRISSEIEPLFAESFKIKLSNPVVFNFIWLPFDLRQFRENHMPFAEVFRDEHGVGLDTVLTVVAALCYGISLIWWNQREVAPIFRLWQRAYEGPIKKERVAKRIQALVPAAARMLHADIEQLGEDELSRGIQFWELSGVRRSDDIDLAYPGPHSIFLPCSDDLIFIDYTWITRRLYNLFTGVNIPDQNFKGDALEKLVRHGESVLPLKGCKLRKGEKKQIDAAFEVGNRLVIIECKAVGKSISFDRGDTTAIQYRNRLIDKALKEVDEKAQWLAIHPKGTNYDVSHLCDILPIVVTPFVEYIPSTASYYWLTEKLPRVLTPKELEVVLRDGALEKVTGNTTVRIEKV
jgi:hypothetical protein